MSNLVAVLFKKEIKLKAYSAAYTNKETTNKLNEFGLEKERFHITTCFDESGAILKANTLNHKQESALISDIVEWEIGDKIYLIALLSDCKWTKNINIYMKLFGAVEILDHIPHITLIKDCESGISIDFKDMIGMQLFFDYYQVKSF